LVFLYCKGIAIQLDCVAKDGVCVVTGVGEAAGRGVERKYRMIYVKA